MRDTLIFHYIINDETQIRHFKPEVIVDNIQLVFILNYYKQNQQKVDDFINRVKLAHKNNIKFHCNPVEESVTSYALEYYKNNIDFFKDKVNIIFSDTNLVDKFKSINKDVFVDYCNSVSIKDIYTYIYKTPEDFLQWNHTQDDIDKELKDKIVKCLSFSELYNRGIKILSNNIIMIDNLYYKVYFTSDNKFNSIQLLNAVGMDRDAIVQRVVDLLVITDYLSTHLHNKEVILSTTAFIDERVDGNAIKRTEVTTFIVNPLYYNLIKVKQINGMLERVLEFGNFDFIINFDGTIDLSVENIAKWLRLITLK